MKKKILFVSDDFNPAATGVGVHMQIVGKELVKKGHEVYVFTAKLKDQSDYEEWEGIKVYRFFSINIAGFYQVIPNPIELNSLLKKHQFDIIHYHYISQMMLMVNFLAKSLKHKKVFTYHMTEEHLTQLWFTRPLRTPFKMLITAFSNTMDVLICPSSNLPPIIKKKGIDKRSVVITNPISLDFFSRAPALEAPETLDEKFVIFYAGRLNPEKNVPLLINAFYELSKENPHISLYIAGRGDQEEALNNLVTKHSLQDKVTFLGFLSQDDLSTYYSLCNVFVLPSIHETQGMVAMEAMRFKRPIIVTKEIVSAKELVDEGVNGYIVDGHDPHELKERLSTLMHSKELQKRMGEKGFEKTNNYNPTVVTDQLIQVYNSIGA